MSYGFVNVIGTMTVCTGLLWSLTVRLNTALAPGTEAQALAVGVTVNEPPAIGLGVIGSVLTVGATV